MEITFAAYCSLGMEVRLETLTVEVDDNATPEQIEAAKEQEAKEWAFNEFEWSWD